MPTNFLVSHVPRKNKTNPYYNIFDRDHACDNNGNNQTCYRNGVDENKFDVDDVINIHEILLSDSKNRMNESKRDATSFQDSTVLHTLDLTHIETPR
jgi:hypothetical protein